AVRIEDLIVQSAENAKTIRDIESRVKEYELLDTPLADIGMGLAEGLGWLGGNVAKLWGDDGYDRSQKPMEILREARLCLSNERTRAAGLVRQISEAQIRCLNLEADLQVNTQMQKQMPELVQAGGNLYDTAGKMVQLMLLLKTKSVDLCRKAADISVYASTDALIDPRLTDEVKMVLDELVSGYEGTSLDADLGRKLNMVTAELKRLEA
ncbi:hypothetical protein FZEAL_6249, partial [Fusarium zealandicum]